MSKQLEMQSTTNNSILEKLDKQQNVIHDFIASNKHLKESYNQPSHDSSLNHGPSPPSSPSMTQVPMSNHGAHCFSLEQDPPHKLPIIHSQNPTKNIFGNNKFSLACSEKIKYLEIKSSLKIKSLDDDSVIQLE
jgi:hypothetical protein